MWIRSLGLKQERNLLKSHHFNGIWRRTSWENWWNTYEEQPIVVNEGFINSSRQRYVSTRLASHEVIPKSKVNDEGEFLHFALLIDSQHVNYEIALSDEVWKNVTIEELYDMNKNNTWEPTKFPTNKKAIDVKWTFKLKLKPNGEISKLQTRLVARGFIKSMGLITQKFKYLWQDSILSEWLWQ